MYLVKLSKGDFARGQRTLPQEVGAGSFATGQSKQRPRAVIEGDFAKGQRTSGKYCIRSFAEGMMTPGKMGPYRAIMR
jgi:hypothetical protein